MENGEKNYLVIDLEMCKVTKANRRREYNHGHEIIQIGAVLLDDGFSEISRFSTYVRPRYGKVDWFIENLTGIEEKHVKHAPELAETLQMMFGWLNGRSVEVYTWSDTDLHQLKAEVLSKRILTQEIAEFLASEHWHDYQKTFGDRFEMHRAVGLSEAMDLIRLPLEGRAHDGLEDAYNTGRLIAKLELDPNLTLPEDYQNAREEETESLSFSMGSLFAGLNLELPA